jgi:hypothetical protein
MGTKNDGGTGEPHDGEFIAIAGNYFDELLAVVEAAKILCAEADLGSWQSDKDLLIEGCQGLRKALNELEAK